MLDQAPWSLSYKTNGAIEVYHTVHVRNIIITIINFPLNFVTNLATLFDFLKHDPGDPPLFLLPTPLVINQKRRPQREKRVGCHLIPIIVEYFMYLLI